MPKEKINAPCDRRTPATVGDGALVPKADDAIWEVSAVAVVGWHRDGWVQVSIEADRSYLRFAADNPDGDTSDRSSVYTEPLTREEINKLIRALRRARDQVFGRDE